MRPHDHAEQAAEQAAARARDMRAAGTRELNTAAAAARHGGQPLAPQLRAQMEAELGADLRGVRVHTHTQAAEAARALGARAFSQGGDLLFGAGAYDPSTSAGRQLLAYELAHTLQPATQIRRQVYGPAAPTGAGTDFDNFMLQFQALEAAAISEGDSLNERITAFRKIYYDSAKAVKTYAGATISGGAFNILIPGAASTLLTPSWSGSMLAGAVTFLKDHKDITIGGQKVDIGHMLTGADAAKHPTPVSLAAGMVRLRSNQEAATFVGDLGSVVEYIKGSPASFRDTAFAGAIKLGSLQTAPITLFGRTYNVRDFTGNVAKLREDLQEQVFNAALAYAAGKGHKGDVALVLKDRGPGLVAPTFWEMYWNVSRWVVDIFIARMRTMVGRE